MIALVVRPPTARTRVTITTAPTMRAGHLGYQPTGCAIERAYVDKGYRGHTTERPRRVFISGQKRGVFGVRTEAVADLPALGVREHFLAVDSKAL